MTDSDDLGMPLRQMHISIGENGELRYSYFGDSPSGEGNVSEVARLVVLTLNALGEEWGEPTPPRDKDDSADAVAFGPAGMLRLQVTRVPHDPAFWKQVSANGGLSSSASPAELAGHLIAAIRQKAVRYSGHDKYDTMLVLDGLRGFAYDTPPVLKAFAALHLEDARNAGFGDIALVGASRFVNLLNPPVANVWWRAP